MMQVHTTPKYQKAENSIRELLLNFEQNGQMLGPGERNKIKIFELEGEKLNIKSFKIPNSFNKLVYRFFRKSKAERSFLYASKLKQLGIGTPQPIAYAEEKKATSLQRSFYVSIQQDYDFTFRELDLAKPGHEEILRAFTRFTLKLHKNNVEFLDHSPGNTLIKLNEDREPDFYLVDLNRMNFKELDFDARMKNFARLSPHKEVVAVMASEYARCTGRPEAEVFEKMWKYTNEFQEKFWRKQRLKQKLGLKKGVIK